MESLLPVLIFIGWIVISVISRMAGKKKKAQQDAEPGPLTKSFQDLLREAAGERRIEAEPPPPPTPNRPPISEYWPTASEHRPTASEHRPTASEHRPTASEHRPTASEHRPTASEHQAGDVAVDLPPPAKLRKYRLSPFAKALLADLAGPESLRRSIVLREVLGPPVSLRQPNER